MNKRKPYFKKSGKFIRGTIVKPKYFKEKMVVDLDFKTKTTSDESGQLTGRETENKDFEKIGVLRTDSGIIIGRPRKFSSPYPRTYPISTRQKGRIKTKRIPVLHLEHFD